MKFPIALLLAYLTAAAAPRPMTFLDVAGMRSVSKPVISPDGRRAVYSLSSPDWKEGKSFSDIYLVPTAGGPAAARRLTFTAGRNETDPQWSRDGAFIVFESNREAPSNKEKQTQLYAIRPDGGEARRLGDHKDGAQGGAFSHDGKWLAYLAGPPEQRQIWTIAAAGLHSAEPRQLTRHATPVESFLFSRDGTRIYFVAPDADDKANRERIRKKFTARLRNEVTPLRHLWAIELDTGKELRLTSGTDYSVSTVAVSPDSKWVAFRGVPSDRYLRTVTESPTYADLYLLEASSGRIERLTNNVDVRESALSFSPDGAVIAFTAADDFTYFRNEKIYVRPVTGGEWRELGGAYDEQMGLDFWSTDGRTIYFNGGHRATGQLFAVSLATGTVRQVSRVDGVLSVDRDEDTNAFVARFTGPDAPPNFYVLDDPEDAAVRAKWKPLTDANPQVRELALGKVEAVQWKSTDGRMIEGVLVKPVGYEAGKRYPLIVQIHGGPAGASTLAFNASHGTYSHIYAGAGYACLLPNYRGSSNYGQRHRMEISGDYFRLGYDDIMTGVDHLIAQGIADPDRLGAMGWSAGGHWSNWILTHTDRFKAISSGAGAMNWISMYAQSDVQRNREFYYQGPPYDRFEHYWDVSPLKYIKNAKTPTLIHVVDGDPRVPRPQSEELHMALRKLGVPTEFLVYPGSTHGIPDARNQMVKMKAEFNWFERYIRGRQTWLDWQELLDTLDDSSEPAKTSDAER
ncbi:MAG: S9 family peptidase [Bryobacteraceae bacterium]